MGTPERFFSENSIGISPSRKPLEAQRLQVHRHNTKVLLGILLFAYPQGYGRVRLFKYGNLYIPN
jgi:hypothetical protein